MNKSTTSRILMYVVISCMLLSCNNGGEKTTETKTTDSVSTAPAAKPEPAVVNTIVTTPQHMLILRMKVADFAKWFEGYEGRDSIRLESGLQNYVIGRSVDDSNMVLVALKPMIWIKPKHIQKNPA